MRTNQKSNVGPAAQEHPAVVATKCPRTNYQKPHDRLPRCFAENSRMDDRLSLRSRCIRRRSSDRDPNSIVETADATRETNLAITVTQLLRRNAPHRARSLEGHAGRLVGTAEAPLIPDGIAALQRKGQEGQGTKSLPIGSPDRRVLVTG